MGLLPFYEDFSLYVLYMQFSVFIIYILKSLDTVVAGLLTDF
jgi:hypothetical protein